MEAFNALQTGESCCLHLQIDSITISTMRYQSHLMAIFIVIIPGVTGLQITSVQKYGINKTSIKGCRVADFI